MKEPEDALMHALGDAARAEEAHLSEATDLEADLARLTLGELPAGRRAELERRAQSDPRLARALEIFTPPSGEQLARATELVLAGLAKGEAARERDGPTPRNRAAPQRPVPAPPPRRRRPWFTRASFLIGSASLGAAGLVAILAIRTSPVTLPEYSVVIAGGDALERGGSAAREPVLRLWLDGEIDLVLRPARDVAARISAIAVVRDPRGVSRPLPVRPQVSPSGAVRIAGRVRDVFPPELRHGTLEVELVVVGETRASGRARISIPVQLRVAGP